MALAHCVLLARLFHRTTPPLRAQKFPEATSLVKKKHISFGRDFSCFSAHWMEQDLFYKGRSQEKTHLLRPGFFLLLSPLDGAGSVLTARTGCSVAGQCGPAVWVFSTSGFHRFFATKPVSSETNKAERGQIWRP